MLIRNDYGESSPYAQSKAIQQKKMLNKPKKGIKLFIIHCSFSLLLTALQQS